MKEKAKVYFTDFRALPGTSLQQKLTKLMKSVPNTEKNTHGNKYGNNNTIGKNEKRIYLSRNFLLEMFLTKELTKGNRLEIPFSSSLLWPNRFRWSIKRS